MHTHIRAYKIVVSKNRPKINILNRALTHDISLFGLKKSNWSLLWVNVLLVWLGSLMVSSSQHTHTENALNVMYGQTKQSVRWDVTQIHILINKSVGATLNATDDRCLTYNWRKSSPLMAIKYEYRRLYSWELITQENMLFLFFSILFFFFFWIPSLSFHLSHWPIFWLLRFFSSNFYFSRGLIHIPCPFKHAFPLDTFARVPNIKCACVNK